MKKQLLILLAVMVLALHGNSFYAQNNQGNKDNNGNKNDQNDQGNQNDDYQGYHPDFSTWTEPKIIQWDDSVRKALNPDLEIMTATMPTDTSTSTPSIKRAVAQVINNTYIPNSVAIDKTKAVGEIPIQSGVSPAGAIIYSVPIEVYPGIHGMQPELSIAYNNQAGNGILGVGWGISGLSSIMRGNQSLYYDGKSQGVAMTKNDAFYIDGTRLIKTSETTAQIKYESEQGNIKATANLNGTVVKYFDVYFPNGIKGTYGYTSNTLTDYLEYPLITLSDLYGNTITYSYLFLEGHYRINKISYANASVVFQYQTSTRPDVITTYSGGLKSREYNLLQSITCNYGASVLRTYSFTYTLLKDVSTLTAINYAGYGGVSFNPLRFYYGENNTANLYTKNDTQLMEWYVWTDKNQIRINKGKFDYGTDNDGLIVLPNKNSYWQYSVLVTKRFDNLYSGTEKIFLYTGLNSSFATPMPNLTTEAGFVDILCANVDGKYDDEVIKINDVVSGSNDQVTFKTYSANVYTGLGLKSTKTFNFPTVLNVVGSSIQPKFYYTGDFNGDGKMEILAVSCHQPFGLTDRPTKCYLFDLESNTKLYEGQPFAYNVTFAGTNLQDSATIVNNTDRLYILDYDGDGKSDICLINANGTYIYTFDVSGTTYTMRQVASYTGLKRAELSGRELFIGEFNGDGKPDFLLSPTGNASDWYIYYSMGNGTFEKNQFSIVSKKNGYSYLLQDVNSDGLTDVIEYNSAGFWAYRAKNGGFAPLYDSNATFNSSNSILIPTNINNRNYFHQLIALKDGKVTRFSYQRNDTKEILLTGSATSLGVVNKNYYRMLNDTYTPGFYTKGGGAVYPYENFQGPLYVPECREQYFNGTRIENINYSYENAVIHKQGRGFCGFEKINTYDNVRGRSQTQKFDPFKFDVLKENDSPTAKTTNTWSFDFASNKIVKVQLTNQSLQNKLKGITVTSSYTYDTYGNPLTETFNYGGGITATVSNGYYNNTNESGYLLGYQTDQTKTVNRNGSTWSQRSYIPVHNSKGQPTVLVKYSNGNQVSQETFGYDAQGNTTSYGVKPYTSSTALTSNYVYDSYGRLTKETDPLGFNTTYEYNATNGSLSNVKNHKGQATTYGYDAFFRLTSYTYPEGTNGVTQYSWNSGGINELYYIYKCETGKPWTRTYYDALGRNTTSSGLNFNYSEPRIEKQYDSYGRLQKVSLPSFGSPAYWNIYQYDSYDRPVKLTEASDRITSYSYSGNTVTTTEDGITSTQTFDNQENLISVSDPGGTITYNLRPDGQPSSIVAPGNVTTSFSYDNYGRRLSIVDPSAGTQSCTYDVAGNVATETNANNKTISYKYDAFNRLTTKIQPEFSTTYVYNSDGLLGSATSTNSTSITYQYDTYGRLYKEKEAVPDGKWLEKTFNYANSYLESTKYASSSGTIVTENYIHDAGHLTEIKLNGTTSIWKLTVANAFGQTTKVLSGNLERNYGYTSFGLPGGRMTKPVTGSPIQNMSCKFDVTKGILSSRSDNNRYIQENFSYDNLNRLTNYGGKTATYNANGNINSKTDVGTFQYNTPGKPYALSGVSSPTNLIPQRNQTIAYTSFKRPASITEGEYTAALTYNGDGGRVKMDLKKNGAKELTRYYISDCYEIDDRAVGGIKEKLYLDGDFYTASAVYVKDGSGSWQIYYICRDYLGSITHIANSSGAVVQELSYDAWGQLRNPANQTAYAPGTAPEPFLGRGYTGHEHLPQFGLINMNARLYDPALGRFLSPDPFVQNPLFSQNFNRFSYVLNNPLVYTDKDGQFFGIDNFFVGFFKGLFRGENPFKTGWRDMTNDFKVWGGLFNGNFTQILSRFTWELPQTIAGFAFSEGNITFGDVKKVDYWGGATVLQNSGSPWTGITIGPYISGNNTIEADPNNSLFQHEYGHYLQSQSMGWAYISRVGIPSLMSANDGYHKYQPFEQDANRRAFAYFNKHVSGFYKSPEDQSIYGNSKGWNFYDNPLDVNHIGANSRYDYYDYQTQMDLINSSLTLHAKWYDYLGWPLGGLTGILGIGVGNGIYYNNHRVK